MKRFTQLSMLTLLLSGFLLGCEPVDEDGPTPVFPEMTAQIQPVPEAGPPPPPPPPPDSTDTTDSTGTGNPPANPPDTTDSVEVFTWSAGTSVSALYNLRDSVLRLSGVPFIPPGAQPIRLNMRLPEQGATYELSLDIPAMPANPPDSTDTTGTGGGDSTAVAERWATAFYGNAKAATGNITITNWDTLRFALTLEFQFVAEDSTIISEGRAETRFVRRFE